MDETLLNEAQSDEIQPDGTQLESRCPPYDEETIVKLVTVIYKTLIRLGQFEEDQIVWPPAAGHTLDFSLLKDDTRIDQRVISLIQRLPFPRKAFDHCLLTDAHKPVDYTSGDRLATLRDIDNLVKADFSREPDQSNALPTDFVLFEAKYVGSTSIVLNVAKNYIRDYETWEEYLRNGGSREDHIDGSQPPDVEDYKTWPTTSAPLWLQEMHENFLNARWMPWVAAGNSILFLTATYPRAKEISEKIRRRILDEYRWPGEDFRREDWLRDNDELIRAVYMSHKTPEGIYMP